MIRYVLIVVFSICFHDNIIAQFLKSDTLFLQREVDSGYYHAIFIDSNPKNKFYKEVSSFRFGRFDDDSYKSSLLYLKHKKIKLTKTEVADLPKEWVLLHKYQGKYFAYAPSDYYSHYKVKITDSCLIEFTGEGPEAQHITQFQKKSNSTYQLTLISLSSAKTVLSIKYIDKARGIATFHIKRLRNNPDYNNDYTLLMIEAKKIRQVPIIVNYCENQKTDEWKFDDVEYTPN